MVCANLTCCPACCHTQVDIFAACPDCSQGFTGFVFYDNQDSRQAETDGVLMLSFGAFYNEDEQAGDGMDAEASGTDGAGAEARPAPEAGPGAMEEGGEEEEEEQSEGYKAASRAVGAKVVAALRSQGLQVEWEGDTHSRIQVQGIPVSERKAFKLRVEDALWVDEVNETRVANSQPPEARCSHTCGAGVRPCPHGLCVEVEHRAGNCCQ